MNEVVEIRDELYLRYFNALLKGNRVMCRELVMELVEKGTEIGDIYEFLFRHSLYQVGELWERNKISVATEHMATAITESMMVALQPYFFASERIGKRAVIACVANEFHQVGAKMIADTFEMSGWDTFFIGSNTPANELLRFIETNKPDVAGLSLSIYFNFDVLKNALGLIRKEFPGLPVLLGGQAFRWGGTEIINDHEKAFYVDSTHALQDFIRKFSAIR
jgi:MerR family transcriptional regulator, light-induced transcriptional regulator